MIPIVCKCVKTCLWSKGFLYKNNNSYTVFLPPQEKLGKQNLK